MTFGIFSNYSTKSIDLELSFSEIFEDLLNVLLYFYESIFVTHRFKLFFLKVPGTNLEQFQFVSPIEVLTRDVSSFVMTCSI